LEAGVKERDAKSGGDFIGLQLAGAQVHMALSQSLQYVGIGPGGFGG
jgi:hypothetical protein